MITNLFQAYTSLNCTPSLIRLFHRPGMDDEKATFPPGEGFALRNDNVYFMDGRKHPGSKEPGC